MRMFISYYTERTEYMTNHINTDGLPSAIFITPLDSEGDREFIQKIYRTLNVDVELDEIYLNEEIVEDILDFFLNSDDNDNDDDSDNEDPFDTILI
jgi:hypothetical protein